MYFNLTWVKVDRVYKDVSQEPDTASASVKKQRFGVMFFIITKDKPRQKLKIQ